MNDGHRMFTRSFALLIRIAIVAVIVLQPDDERLGLATEGGASILVEGGLGEVAAPLAGPLQHRIFLKGILLVQLLEQDGEELGLVLAKELGGTDEVTLHGSRSEGDLGDDVGPLLDLLLLEEVDGEDAAEQDVDLVVRLETGGHLLVDDDLGNVGGRGVGIVGEELLGTLDGELHGGVVVDLLAGGDGQLLDAVGSVRSVGSLILLGLFLLVLLVLLGLLLLLSVIAAIVALALFLLLLVLLSVLPTLGLVLLALVALLLLGLGLLVLGQDVRAKLVVHVDHLLVAARHALVVDAAGLDLVVRLGQAALGTQDEDVDVLLDGVLQDLVVVRAVDDGPVGVGVVGRLGAELGAEKFVHLPRLAVEGQADLRDVGDDGLDAVTAALDLAEDAGHLVAVLGIVDGGRPGDVDDGSWRRHGCCSK
mmetsp:Transcript_19777/g.56824  ORF Transcript_19777/g.56824 Transcript_19777/m.56824 type:complete len:422 (-) Transcript_19777:397-1662(-)